MELIEHPTEVPTFKRWFAMHRRTPKVTILRALQYEALEKCSFSGHVLDFGGGKTTSYQRFLAGADRISSVNINQEFEPTHIIPVGADLPFDAESFEHAVCLNVLEHIYDPIHVMAEIHRVLKPNGTMIIAVPFIYRVHGHPDDFSRLTSSWWIETCRRLGYRRLAIEAQIWGRLSTARLISSNGLFKKLNRMRNMLGDLIIARLLCPRASHYTGKFSHRVGSVPIGWFMTVTK